MLYAYAISRKVILHRSNDTRPDFFSNMNYYIKHKVHELLPLLMYVHISKKIK